MRNFFEMCAFAAIASKALAQVEFDPATLCPFLDGAINASQDDCEALPDFAFVMFNTANYAWERYVAQSADGYDTSLVRITGDETGNPVPFQGSKGAVLLRHGATIDGSAWFNASFVYGDAPLPVLLF